MSYDYDLVVLGSGPGGYVAAAEGSKHGLKTAIVEKKHFGGTCLNVGCIPTKALIASVEQLLSFKKNREFGILCEGSPTFDFDKIMARKGKIVKQLGSGVEMLLKNSNVDIFNGVGELKDANTIKIVTEDGTQEITADAIILATGSVPSMPPIKGIDGKNVINSDHLLSIEKVPASLTIIGGGAIGTEFAYIFNALGTKVTILECLPHILPQEDEDIAESLTSSYKKVGIKVFANSAVSEIADDGEEKLVRYTLDGEEKELRSEYVLIATGRAPKIDGMGFAECGLTIERRAVKVDEYLYTGVAKIYGIGDCVGGMLLAHKASAEAIVAVKNILGEKIKADYRAIPRVVYCHPEVATVGLTRAQAEEMGYEVAVASKPFMGVPRAMIMSDRDGFFKLIADKKSGAVLGAFAIGPHVTEMITEMTLAIQKNLTVEDILNTIHPHPSLSEIFHEAAELI